MRSEEMQNLIMKRTGKIAVVLATMGLLAPCATFAQDKVEIDDLKAKMPELSKKLAPVAAKKIDFAKDIKPLFEKSCFNCHGGEKRPKSKFRIDNREMALKGGSEGISIISGKSERSILMYYISDMVNEYEMPPVDKRDKYPGLTKEQLGMVRAWIDQGVKYE